MRFVPRKLFFTGDLSRGRPNWRIRLRTLITLGVLVSAIYLLLGWTADRVADSISAETEVRLFRWIDLGNEPRDDPAFDRAQSIFQRMLAAPDLRPLPYHLVLFDMEGPNAFALPGGLVAVTPDLLAELDHEIGLAFVLAHELGHHQHRHALKRLGRTLLYRLAIAAVAGPGDMSLVQNGVWLASQRYSREQEHDADRFGMERVHQVFGTTQGALEFFEAIHAQFGESSPLGAMFQTHPLTSERLERLRLIAAELNPSAPLVDSAEPYHERF